MKTMYSRDSRFSQFKNPHIDAVELGFSKPIITPMKTLKIKIMITNVCKKSYFDLLVWMLIVTL